MRTIPRDPLEQMLKKAFPPVLAGLLGDLITISEDVGYAGEDAWLHHRDLVTNAELPSTCDRQVEALRKLIEELHDPNYFNHPNPATGKKNAVPRSL